ncbi:MAG: hypothetical protein Q9216_003808, partial [Gyalolechia sp. 2 TL-2023]
MAPRLSFALALAHLILSTRAAGTLNASLGVQPIWQGGQILCAQFYGAFTSNADCLQAAEKLPIGDEELVYHISSRPHYYFKNRFPISRVHGNCMVQVELAGERIPPTIRIVPDDIRRVSEYIMDTCVLGEGKGGFATGNLHDMKGWLASEGGDLSRPM